MSRTSYPISPQSRSAQRAPRCLPALPAAFALTLTLTFALALLPAAPALAQSPTVDPSSGRSAPDDEARGWASEPGTEVEDVLLFVPRAVLYVPRFGLQMVFYPVGELLGFLERRHVIPWVRDALSWNEAGTAGIRPSLAYASSTGVSAGFTVFHDDLLGNDERLAATLRFGGAAAQYYELELDADRFLGTRTWLGVLARYEADTDLLFAGLGVAPRACDRVATPPRAASCPTRFSQERVLAVLRGGYTYGGPGNIAQLGAEAVVNHRRFGASAEGDDEPDDLDDLDDGELEDDDLDIGSVYDTAQLVGFADGSTTLELLGRLVVDTRAPRGLVDPGVRFEAFAGGAVPVAGYAFAHYGAELSATTPLFWRTRLLTVRAALEAVHGGADDIPFAELSRLGGPDRLRGYAVDQLRDRLALLASASYRYPVHHAISGVLFVDVGTVAPRYDALLDDLDDLRVGFGGGLVFGDADDVALRVDIGYGDGLHLYVSTEPPRAFSDRSEQL